MKEKVLTLVLLVILFLSGLAFIFKIQPVSAQPRIIYVDDDNIVGPWDGTQLHPYQNITSGLNHALSGETVFVLNGTYHEKLFIEKSLSLVGQSSSATIIDGGGNETIPVILIFNTTDVSVSGFTVQNTTSISEAYGISIWQGRNVTIRSNVVTKSYFGILLGNSTLCKILDNKIVDNYNSGMVFRSRSSKNYIIGNSIVENPTGIYIESYSQNNTFYRNNIINNTLQVNIFPYTHSSWDNGVEGNYWFDYNGIDQNGDGIGDTYLPHLWVDSHPLIEPWNETRIYPAPPDYEIVINCNYTVASFKFNQTLREINFYITGPSGWSGYCNVTIPKELLNPKNASEKWIVMFGSNPLVYTNETVNNSTSLSFRYTLGSSMSENRVRLKVGVFYPPTANFEFAPSMPIVGETVIFNDTSVQGNETIVLRTWDFGDGVVENTTEQTINHTYTAFGNYTVKLTVIDSEGITDSYSKLLEVIQYPIAVFTYSPALPLVNELVVFNASNSTPRGEIIISYQWNFGDETSLNTTSPIGYHTFEHTGNYTVRLTVYDHNGLENSTVHTVKVVKGTTEVTIVAPTTVKVEELFVVNATLRDYGGQPLVGEQIEFYIYDDELVLSRNGTTGNDGVARAMFSLSVSGGYLIKAEYKGGSDYLERNNTTFITVNLLDTILTLQASENITQNEEFPMFATLLDENEKPVYDVNVEFYFYNGSLWEFLGASKTNQSGVASFSYAPQYSGTFLLKAVFNGTGTYAASNSSQQSFTVVAPGIDYVPYVLLVIIIVVAVCLVFLVLKRRTSSNV